MSEKGGETLREGSGVSESSVEVIRTTGGAGIASELPDGVIEGVIDVLIESALLCTGSVGDGETYGTIMGFVAFLYHNIIPKPTTAIRIRPLRNQAIFCCMILHIPILRKNHVGIL